VTAPVSDDQDSEAPSTEPQRWARVPPGLAWKRPGLPKDWVPVLERHPDGLATPLTWCWLDVQGKPRHVAEHLLEFREGRRCDGGDVR
jgi:hypothetical protein